MLMDLPSEIRLAIDWWRIQYDFRNDGVTMGWDILLDIREARFDSW